MTPRERAERLVADYARPMDGPPLADMVETAITEAIAATREEGVPAGWKLVPIEPTEAMAEAWEKATVFEDVWAEGGNPVLIPTHDLHDVWPALIAAASPTPGGTE